MTAARIGLAYQPTGFRQRGGIQRLAIGVAHHLQQQGGQVSLLTAPQIPASLQPQGLDLLPWGSRLADLDILVIFGCNQPWAYGLALKALLRAQGPRIHWLPSFHDPRWVAHPGRARLAQLALRLLQPAGVTVHGQTSHEVKLLNGGRCQLSRHALSDGLRQQLEAAVAPDAGTPRPLDLLFFGRPTVQKGWARFLSLARRGELRCGAIVPFPPPEQNVEPIVLVVNPSDAEIPSLLRQAKVVLVPADYESFGIAQLEAVAQGCVVPILGRWPLWDGFQPLQWQNLEPAQLGAACLDLCHEPQRRRSLVDQQLAYLRRHPIQSQPFLLEPSEGLNDD